MYPDVIESSGVRGTAAVIKTHHNVGGLPERLGLELVEPLRDLFKDEVRSVGEALGLPHDFVWRHPFPGPGLAVRMLGAVTRERVRTLQDADAIVIEEIRSAGLYDEISQALSVLLPVKSVGVMGDARTYEDIVAIRAVTSRDAMTADWARLPHKLLAKVSNHPQLPPELKQEAKARGIDPCRLVFGAKLSENRLITPLFDTPAFVGYLESAYQKMRTLFVDGWAPQSFEVSPD